MRADPEKFYPYLYSIAQHKSVDHRRADIRHSRIAQQFPDLEFWGRHRFVMGPSDFEDSV